MISNNPIKFIFAAILYLCINSAGADTFTNILSKEVLHGYKTGETQDGNSIVRTTEKGIVSLNLAHWGINSDRKGRNNKVYVFSIDDIILYEIETAAFEKALPEAVSQGPIFILIEIDTPGGRVDLARRICAAITAQNNCQIVGYVKTGEHGGALSAGAAISLACDKIYMASNTVIGAATMITADARTMKKAFGEEVGEKFDSAWRAMLASLAEQNGRPGLLARAMVDRDIEVIEVSQGNKVWFIDPINKKDNHVIIKTWSKKGSLLTLTAAEALQCGISDGIAESREELLRLLEAQDAEIILDRTISDARVELNRAEGQLSRIRKDLDLKIKQSKNPMSQAEAFKLLREAKGDFKALVNLSKKYPDLELDTVWLENELNSVEAAYRNARRQSRRH